MNNSLDDAFTHPHEKGIFEDDGVGIGKKKKNNGIGLFYIKSRIEMLNGSTKFENGRYRGIIFQVKIPLEKCVEVK